MTDDQLNYANHLKEQISKLKSLKNRIQKDYDIYKTEDNSKQLLETLSQCMTAVNYLVEIHNDKFKTL